jgi:hypothetical protein
MPDETANPAEATSAAETSHKTQAASLLVDQGELMMNFGNFLQRASPEDISFLGDIMVEIEGREHWKEPLSDVIRRVLDEVAPASSPEWLADLDDDDIQSVRTFAQIVRDERGCGTPFEEFVTTLVMLYKLKKVTPADIELRYQEFRDNLEGAIRDTHVMLRDYPKEFATAAEAPQP